MLRRLINAIIPNKGIVFFDLFIAAAINVAESAQLIKSILDNHKRSSADEQISASLRLQRQKAIEIHQSVLVELNQQFITPLDRGDIQELSVLLLKLSKRIVKIQQTLKIYSIKLPADDCLSHSVATLENISSHLVSMMNALKHDDYSSIAHTVQLIEACDDSAIEDLRHAIKGIYSDDYDTLTIIKLKEIYKSIENAVDTSINIADLVMQISIKDA